MRAVGIRELRQHASRIVREVERGQVIQVTDRGRPVAVIRPLRAQSPLESLRAIGDVSEPTGTLADLAAPLRRGRGEPPPSATLARLRAHER